MPFHVLISCNLLTENVLYHAMYRYLDKKLPKSGNDILVLSHSPNPTQQRKHSEVGIENRGCTHLRCVLRQVLARYVQNIREKHGEGLHKDECNLAQTQVVFQVQALLKTV